MKTNHRRAQPADTGGFDYGVEMVRRLQRNGCGPNYTRSVSAIAVIAAKKKKDHRVARHRADADLLRNQNNDYGATRSKRFDEGE